MNIQKPKRCSKTSFKREVCSNTVLPQEIRKKSQKLLHIYISNMYYTFDKTYEFLPN